MTKTILAYGDSLTWGYSAEGTGRHAYEDRWPTVLEAELAGKARVIPDGLNGRTTAFDDHLSAADRNAAKTLATALLTHAPLDLVIIMLGANDMQPWIHGSPFTAKYGLLRLVEIVRGTDYGFGWQAQIWVNMIPTLIYVFLFFGQAFPKPHVEGVTSVSKNFKAMLSLLYIFIFCCMAFTAISEFGPQQWVGLIMAKSGASPMLILALVTGLMAIGRYFAGPIIHRLDQTGVLLGSAVFATIGIYLYSSQTGAGAYIAAVFFAIGVCYFWPTMIGFVAERIPLSGALGMSIVGGVGMFSTAIFQPIIGGWIDDALSLDHKSRRQLCSV